MGRRLTPQEVAELKARLKAAELQLADPLRVSHVQSCPCCKKFEPLLRRGVEMERKRLSDPSPSTHDGSEQLSYGDQLLRAASSVGRLRMVRK